MLKEEGNPPHPKGGSNKGSAIPAIVSAIKYVPVGDKVAIASQKKQPQELTATVDFAQLNSSFSAPVSVSISASTRTN